MRTIPLYLMALIVAIAKTPLDVFQVDAWNVGTLKIESWRRKLPSAVLTVARARLARIRAWFQVSGGLPTAVAALLVILLIVPHFYPHAGALLAVPPLAGLKGYRQRDADLKAEIAKATKERTKIGETVLAENRQMTAEEKTKFLAFSPTIADLEAKLAENAELLAAAEAANEAERVAAAGRTDADARAATAAAAAAGIRVGESAEEKAMKAPGFFGSCLQAVRRLAVHDPAEGDEKLVRMMAGPTGMSSDVPSDGGFAIAPNWSNQIVQRTYETGEILKLVDRLTITVGNGMNLPAIDETSRANNSRYGGIVSGWLGQGNTLSAGKPKMRLMELKLRKAGAFVYQTDELVADAPALQQWVEKYVPLELAFTTEDAVVNGDGSNKPSGILNSGAAITVTRNTASRVLYEDVSAMWARMWAPLRKMAIWMIDQSVEQQLEQLSIAIGTAGVLAPIYRPAGISVGPDGTQGYSPATLYGRPILTTEYGAALGTVGDCVLWAPGEYQLIDKGNVEQMVSLHVAFLTDEAVWRFIYRADGQLKWNAPLTPKSGGSTVSSVVTLT